MHPPQASTDLAQVLSGKGGVGKSSVTTQLALSLCLAGHSVGILDVDLTGPSIPRLLGIEDAKVKQAPGGWLPVEVHAAQYLPPMTGSPLAAPSSVSDVAESSPEAVPPGDLTTSYTKLAGPLHAMSLAFLLNSRSSAIVWRGPKKTAMVRQFLSSVLWPPTDYLLIDTPPGTSDEHISLVETLLKDLPTQESVSSPQASDLAGAVIVTTPQAVSISDVRKELNFCAKTGVKVLGVVENMSGYVCECCGVATNLFSKGGGEVMARDFCVKFLASIPVDAQWGTLVEEGGLCVYEKRENNSSLDEDDSSDEEESLADARNTRDTVTSLSGVEAFASDELQDKRKKRDPRSLVDRYRTCSLSPLFAKVAAMVVDTINDGTATVLSTEGIRSSTA